MEYIEGETLAARLMKGPLPVDQVFKYAIEIADALDKAHRQRHHAPRSEARQHHAHQVRCEAARLWIGEAQAASLSFRSGLAGLHGSRRRHGAGNDPGHASIHGSRTGGRQSSGCKGGYFCVWRRDLRNGDGKESLRRQEPGQLDRSDSGARACADHRRSNP